MGKTNPLNDADLAEFVKLQKTFADSAKSWSVDAKTIDPATFDLSVKYPNGATKSCTAARRTSWTRSRRWTRKARKFWELFEVSWVLTQQRDFQTARKYWNKVQERLGKQGSQVVTSCHRLKMPAADDKQPPRAAGARMAQSKPPRNGQHPL